MNEQKNLSDKIQAHHPSIDNLESLKKLFEDGAYENVINTAIKLSDRFPESDILSNIIGSSYISLSNPQKASRYLQRALQQNPRNSDAHFNLGVLEKKRGNIKGAINHLTQAIQFKIHFPKAFFLLGECYQELQDFPQAIKKLRVSGRAEKYRYRSFLKISQLLLQSNKTLEALEFAEKCLQERPDEWDALRQYVYVQNALSNSGIALDTLHERQLVHADNPELYHLLSDTSSLMGLTDDVTHYLEQGLGIDRNNKTTLTKLFKCYEGQKKLTEALKVARRLLQIAPSDKSSHFRVGFILMEVDELDEALIHLNNGITLDPASIDGRFLLASCQRRLKLNAAAANNFKPIADLLSKSIIANNEMALCLIDMGKPREARALLNTLVTHAPLNADAISNIGLSYEQEMKLDKAYEHFSQAFELSGEARFAANAAMSLQGQGKKEDARAFWAKSIQAEPENPAGYQNYMHLTKVQKDDTIFQELKKRVANAEIDRSDPSTFFALFKGFDDMGEYSSAFEALKQGNDLRASASPFTNLEQRDEFKIIKSIQEVTSKKNRANNMLESEMQHVFIIGMPRSGTTLAEQILTSHSEVTGFGELSFVSTIFNELPLVPGPDLKGYYTEFRRMVEPFFHDSTTKFVVEKTPLNFKFIGHLKSAFPNAKFVYCARDARAVCWSNYKINFFADGLQYSNDLDELVDFYNLHLDYMSFWKSQFEDELYYLDYEALTENQEEETRKLLAFCGLEWQQACLEFHTNKKSVKTASVAQVRNKIYKGSSEAWRAYEEHLEPYFEKLKAMKLDPKGMVR